MGFSRSRYSRFRLGSGRVNLAFVLSLSVLLPSRTLSKVPGHEAVQKIANTVRCQRWYQALVKPKAPSVGLEQKLVSNVGLGGEVPATAVVDPNSTGNKRLDAILNTPKIRELIDKATTALTKQAEQELEPIELRTIKTVGTVGERFVVSRGSGLSVLRNTKIGAREYEVVPISGSTFVSSREIGSHSLVLSETQEAGGEVTHYFNSVANNGPNGTAVNRGFTSKTPIRNLELKNQGGIVVYGDNEALIYVPFDREGRSIGFVQRRLDGISGQIDKISYEEFDGVQYLKVQMGPPAVGSLYYHPSSLAVSDKADRIAPVIKLALGDGHSLRRTGVGETIITQTVPGEKGPEKFITVVRADEQGAVASRQRFYGEVNAETMQPVGALPTAKFYKSGREHVVISQGDGKKAEIDVLQNGKILEATSSRMVTVEPMGTSDDPSMYVSIFSNKHHDAIAGGNGELSTPARDELRRTKFNLKQPDLTIVEAPKGLPKSNDFVYLRTSLKRGRENFGTTTLVTDLKNNQVIDLGNVIETRRVSAAGKSYDVIISEDVQSKKIGMLVYSESDKQFYNAAVLHAEHPLTGGSVVGPSALSFEVIPGSLSVKMDPTKTTIVVSGTVKDKPYSNAVSLVRVDAGKIQQQTLYNLSEPRIVGKHPDQSVYVAEQGGTFTPGVENKSVIVVAAKEGLTAHEVKANVTEVSFSGNQIGYKGELKGIGSTLPVEARSTVGANNDGYAYYMVNKRSKSDYVDPKGEFSVFSSDPSGEHPARSIIMHKNGKVEEIALKSSGDSVISVERDNNLLLVTTGAHKESASTVIYDLDKKSVETTVHNFQGYRDVDRYRFYVGHPSGNGNSTIGVFDRKTNRFLTMYDFGQVKVDLRRADAITRDEKKGQIKFVTSTGATRIFDERQQAFIGLLPDSIRNEFKTLNKELGVLMNDKLFAANDDLIVGREETLRAIHGAMPVDSKLREGPRYVVLKGDSGAGRSAIIQQYMSQVIGGAGADGVGLKPVFFEMDPSKVSAGAHYRGMAQDKFVEVGRVADALRQKGYRLVLVVDNVDRIKPEIGSRYDQETDVLAQLATLKDKTSMDVLVTSKPSGWDALTRQASEFTNGFQEVRVNGMSGEQSAGAIRQLLENRYPGRKVVDDNVIDYTVSTLARLDQRNVMPGPAMTMIKDLVTETLATCKHECTVTRQMINQRIAAKTGLPQLLISGKPEDAKVFLDGLSKHLRSKVSGQDQQIDEIVGSFRSFALGINQKDVPIMSYLVAGPTGVGKTKTLTALTEYVYGDSKALLKINGADYQPPMSGERLHQLTQVIVQHMREYPFNTVLFDEVEKMDPNGAKLLLSLLDGNATDSYGNTISSGMSMIFATSNLGMGQIINQNAARATKGLPKLTTEERNKLHYGGILQHFEEFPELIRRFDGHLFYNGLGDSDTKAIVQVYMKEHIDSAMKDVGVKLVYDDKTLEVMGKAFTDETFGARGSTKEIKRVFTNEFLSAEMLAGHIKAGGTYKLRAIQAPGARYPTFSVETVR